MGDDSDLVTIKTMPSDTNLQIIHGYGDSGFRISGADAKPTVTIAVNLSLIHI